VKKADDKKRIFRQLILSWALPPGEETINVWEDYHSIVDNPLDEFDLYKARDAKQNNMRHIMGKCREQHYLNAE
jgi:hypothetical protein